jgi:hypothetical protein
MVDLGPLRRACGFPDEPCSTCESDAVPDGCLTGFGPPRCTYEACCGAHSLDPGEGAREPVAGVEPKIKIHVDSRRRCCYKYGCGPDCW